MCGGGCLMGEGVPTEKNKTKKRNNRYSLIFCSHALYKISSNWLKWFSGFNKNKRSFRQVRAINQSMFYRIRSKFILT